MCKYNHSMCVFLASLLLLFSTTGVQAQDSQSDSSGNSDLGAAIELLETKANEADAKADEAALAGHNAWMLTCCALVLFMTAPGLAMFYSGLVRKKNVLGVMMQCVFLMGLMSVIWALWGYSLSFGGDGKDNAWIGNGEYLFMNNVARTWDAQAG